jgi:hypothetical protein
VTDRIAVWLAVVIAAAIGADLALNDGAALFFLAQKFLKLIEWGFSCRMADVAGHMGRLAQ